MKVINVSRSPCSIVEKFKKYLFYNSNAIFVIPIYLLPLLNLNFSGKKLMKGRYMKMTNFLITRRRRLKDFDMTHI